MLFTFTHLVDAFIQSDVYHFHGTHSYQFLLSLWIEPWHCKSQFSTVWATGNL